MSEPFLAEIRMVGFNFAPRGWAFCDGAILPINQYQSLYSLLGTTYGGDGRTSFGLPDLRGRTPIHEGNGHSLGQRGGEASHTLTAAEIPSHGHPLRAADTPATVSTPGGNLFARGTYQAYGNPQQTTEMNAIAPAGNGVGHNNTQPSLAVSFCIALQGLFPSRN